MAGEDVPYSNTPKDLLFVNATTQILIGIIVVIIASLFFKRWLERRSVALRWVTLAYLFLGLGIFLGGFAPFLVWTQYDVIKDANPNTSPDPIIYGLPLLLTDLIFGKTIYWPFNAIGYQFAMLSNISLLLFTRAVFDNPKKEYVTAYGISGLAWMILTSYYTLFIYGLELDYPATGSSVSSPGAVTFLLLGLVAYLTLGYQAHVTAQKEQNPIHRAGLRLIELAVAAEIMSYIVFVIDVVIFDASYTFVAWIMGIVSAVLVYLGFIMPEWLVRRLKRYYSIT